MYRVWANLKWKCGGNGAGMPVCEAFAYVEQHRSFFDVVHVKYNDEVRFFVLIFNLGLRGDVFDWD